MLFVVKYDTKVHEMQIYSVMNDKVNTHVTTTQVKK